MRARVERIAIGWNKVAFKILQISLTSCFFCNFYVFADLFVTEITLLCTNKPSMKIVRRMLIFFSNLRVSAVVFFFAKMIFALKNIEQCKASE
jgi:hypothetical protein